MFADHHEVVVLVKYFEFLDHNTVGRPFVISLIRNGNFGGDGVVDEDRPDKAQAIVSVGHRPRVNQVRGGAYSDGKDQGAVGDALFEVLGFAELGIHVVREKVAALPGMEHDVGLGDGAPHGGAFVVEYIVFEVNVLDHSKCVVNYVLKCFGLEFSIDPVVDGFPLHAR